MALSVLMIRVHAKMKPSHKDPLRSHTEAAEHRHRILSHGFTLIEVLLALAILAIGLTSLLKSNAQNIQFASRLKDKAIAHQVAMSAIADIQTNAVTVPVNRETTHTTKALGATWYWRASVSPTTLPSLQQIAVSVSPRKTGPFTNRLIGYRYAP